MTIESEVIAEPEPAGARRAPPPAWRELARLRALRAQLLRNQARTATSAADV
jgi:hypothetical protein